MRNQVQRSCSFRFEIDNFSEIEGEIESPTFVSGGCEWYLSINSKENTHHDDYLSLYLYVSNPESLGYGWKRSANIYFLVLNQSDKELFRSPITTGFQCYLDPGWGFSKTLRLRKLQEKGFLEKDRLIVEVYISRVEVIDGNVGVLTDETFGDINGFKVSASQVTLARKIFVEHPDIAEDFKPKNQVVKAEYMFVLLNLVEKLQMPSQNHSEAELRNAYSELSELMEAGFKLDWLKSKVDEVSLKRKKSDDPDGSLVQQQLDERVKNLELMKLDLKLDCLMTKLEEVSLERKKSDDVDGSLVKEMEGRIKNLEMMVSDLKVKLDKDEAKSCGDDGFLLIDEVA